MTLLDAVQGALAGEHAAVYGYGVVGARLTGGPDEAAARAGYDVHLARRDALDVLVRAAGAEPVAAAVAYELPGPADTPAQARALAADLELGTAATYADLVAVAEAPLRATAAGWLQDAAVRAAGWSGTAATFPGLTERSG
jgi:hypothetical protein